MALRAAVPIAIDIVVYTQTGAEKYLNRVRQIEGVCENVPNGGGESGIFWAGNCDGIKFGASYGDANAFTGWNSVSRIYVEELPSPQQ